MKHKFNLLLNPLQRPPLLPPPLNKHDRRRIMPLPMDPIDQHRRHNNPHPHRRRPIRRSGTYRQYLRETAENNHESAVQERERVDGDTKATERPTSRR